MNKERYDIVDGLKIQKIEVTFLRPNGKQSKLETFAPMHSDGSYFELESEHEDIYSAHSGQSIARSESKSLSLYLQGKFMRPEGQDDMIFSWRGE